MTTPGSDFQVNEPGIAGSSADANSVLGINPGSSASPPAPSRPSSLLFVAAIPQNTFANSMSVSGNSTLDMATQVPAADITTGGVAVAITVLTPAPGGGTSSSFQFEVDSASGSTTGPTFTSTTAIVTAGSAATYPVTLPSNVTSASVTRLNYL